MITTLRARTHAPDALLIAAAGLGCLTLIARSHAPVSAVPTALAGVIGMLAWRHSGADVRAREWLGIVGLGCGAFALTVLMGDVWVPPLAALGAFSLILAAVAEEAFFRRFMFGWLERLGPAVAIGLPAALFGLIHVPAYGWAILPLDIAAGLLLGWQRWASGSWLAPAATHTFANLVMFL